MNYIDLILIIFLGYFFYQGFRKNLLSSVVSFVAFVVSIGTSLVFYSRVSQILQNSFATPSFIAQPLAFVLLASLTEIVISHGLVFIITKLKFTFKLSKKLDLLTKILGGILQVGHGLILLALLVVTVTTLPLNLVIKEAVTNSKICEFILDKTSGLEKGVNQIFGEIGDQSLLARVIEPENKEGVKLDFVKTLDLKINLTDAREMMNLVNQERVKENLSELIWQENLAKVGEDYAKDMWQRKYFAHYSPEGNSVADRLRKAKINFSVVGENLALAPTVKIAHQGLMNSEGHRANILDKNFKKLGIGVVENGFYGKIFVQVFTN